MSTETIAERGMRYLARAARARAEGDPSAEAYARVGRYLMAEATMAALMRLGSPVARAA